ncbi:glycine cleavage system protein R [Thalassotalea marina]|uniref:Glycine cleavage system transcriptional repressor n=1 Tax=Thalassotalea marina TaxID=1673741 RepID=A0A919BED2_9GAMM|nr:ACT domain-containing protein [Thalassotalea marina]GHF83867.1 glycine cleavage system regulatory protein [Thalassotalea marina]
MNHLILSFASPDRPGLVDTISNVIKQYKGNWQTSSLHHLSGFFAGVIEVAVSEEESQALVDQLNSIPDFDCIIKVANQSSSNKGKVTLELTANDRSGIIQEISSTIHHHGGNLIKLVSSRQSAPHTGVELFTATANIDVSEDKLDTLIGALESKADDIMVDISRD